MNKVNLHSHNRQDAIFCNFANTLTCEVELHLHDCYEVFMAVSDNIKYFIEDRVYHLSKYDIVITNAHEIHYPQVINDSPYVRLFVHFYPQYFSNLINTDYDLLHIFRECSEIKHHKISPSPDKKDQLYSDFLNIYQTNQKADSQNKLLTYTYLIQFLIELNTHYANDTTTHKSPTMDVRVKQMIDLIEKTYTSTISLNSLCETLYMDKHYMAHLFKKATGFTVNAFIQTKRIQHAKRMINEGYSIKECCFSCGYEDYSNFYKTFKKLVGTSPRNYALNNKQ